MDRKLNSLAFKARKTYCVPSGFVQSLAQIQSMKYAGNFPTHRETTCKISAQFPQILADYGIPLKAQLPSHRERGAFSAQHHFGPPKSQNVPVSPANAFGQSPCTAVRLNRLRGPAGPQKKGKSIPEPLFQVQLLVQGGISVNFPLSEPLLEVHLSSNQ